MCTAKWVHEAAHCCTYWINFQVEGPFACTMSRPPVPAGAPGGVAGNSPECPAGQPQNPDELLPAIQVHGNQTWASLISPVLGCSSAPGELPDLFYEVPCTPPASPTFFFPYCTEAVQLVPMFSQEELL